ncbi:MvdC/MvdD family ATP grasp protein [Chromobacterium sp. IIBBL 290-4]|uniref:MvdC/MvdD family ATP grasp protein n=1 Tax=Chromobacterium sp. IIBBL 290-4 TaxID=2953890 RepID=UPI0020B7C0BF|nr:hypothetical protein [Chromobacterium sp. IIBBL 290-4]UTH74968.1 hypothetical protein NKT35_02360 [Chromobacterium sp. IIBBL 290-4]
MKVLIVSHSRDPYCPDLVAAALKARGAEPIRLNTDQYPTSVRLNLAPSSAAERSELLTGPAGERFSLDELGAIYFRRLALARNLPDEMPKPHKEAVYHECYAVLQGMLACSDAFQLDPFERVYQADNKPLQLKLARQLGMTVPETLTSNDPEAVRAFYHRFDGDIVAKPLRALTIRDDDVTRVMYTNRVREEHLRQLDSLANGPMTFQQYIPKALELRITVVGERLFCGAVDSQRGDKSRVDWRRDGAGLREEWRPYPVPEEMRRRILRLMDALQLNYGALDLIVTPAGEWVFLEINPAGEFVWMQTATGFPIADALAETLLGQAARRDARRVASPA